MPNVHVLSINPCLGLQPQSPRSERAGQFNYAPAWRALLRFGLRSHIHRKIAAYITTSQGCPLREPFRTEHVVFFPCFA